ncbi:ubiquitin-activating enzyme [Cyclospora cayetanensis]|uniref:Ubiquitin-activating enzyme n=1 Tax=Cyclospora cayetanensis TaxID=88456 RepID=A0A1D3D816_9EIME|nr:ubiquitin-activating enzyme [Cyclospora cayetanensis]
MYRPQGDTWMSDTTMLILPLLLGVLQARGLIRSLAGGSGSESTLGCPASQDHLKVHLRPSQSCSILSNAPWYLQAQKILKFHGWKCGEDFLEGQELQYRHGAREGDREFRGPNSSLKRRKRGASGEQAEGLVRISMLSLEGAPSEIAAEAAADASTGRGRAKCAAIEYLEGFKGGVGYLRRTGGIMEGRRRSRVVAADSAVISVCFAVFLLVGGCCRLRKRRHCEPAHTRASTRGPTAVVVTPRSMRSCLAPALPPPPLEGGQKTPPGEAGESAERLAPAATAALRAIIDRSHDVRPVQAGEGGPSRGISREPLGAATSSADVVACCPTSEDSGTLATQGGGEEDLSLRSFLSRQLLVWGPEQQALLPDSCVLLIGAGGAAVEAAKCLLQSGVGRVLLADPEPPSPAERAANFAVAEHSAAACEKQSAALPLDADATAASSQCSEEPAIQLAKHPELPREPLKGQLPPKRDTLTRAAVACGALRRVAAPYARVSEVSLQQQAGEAAPAWRMRVLQLLEQVDVLLLCDRPLQQKLFFASLARELRISKRRLPQGSLDRQQRSAGPLVVAVCTAGLTGRIAVDFGDFCFSGVNEEAALAALLQKHAQSQEQQREQLQKPHAAEATSVSFPPLSEALSLQGEGLCASQQSERAVIGEEQQCLTAAFEALDAEEAGTLPENNDAERVSDGIGAQAALDLESPEAPSDVGSLRSWNASRAAKAGELAVLMAKGSRGHLAPIAAAMGAFAAQETLKGLTRRYPPLQRPFPTEGFAEHGAPADSPVASAGADDAAIDATVLPSPWAGQQQLLGEELQRHLNHMRVLLVGAGAIGCEVLKNFALMGISTQCPGRKTGTRDSNSTARSHSCNSRCSATSSSSARGGLIAALRKAYRDLRRRRELSGSEAAARASGTSAAAAGGLCEAKHCPGGLLSVMDGDVVEVSNLSRQVLFSFSSLQQPKASAAAAAAARLSSCMQLQAFPLMLTPETLRKLPSMFFQQQDLIVAALDSVEARLYVDALCLLHARPWVEAGTLGLRGHSQSLVPHLTEPYGAAAATAGAPSLAAVPLCSVRGTPTAPLHAVHWASAVLHQTFRGDLAAAHLLLQQLVEQHTHPSVDRPEGVSALDGPPFAASPDASEASSDALQHPKWQQGQSQQHRCRLGAGVVPLSPAHLLLVSWALSLFDVLFDNGGQQQGDLHGSPSTVEDAWGAREASSSQKQQPLSADPTDTDVLDFIAAAGQLLATALHLEQAALPGGVAASASAEAAAAALRQQQAEELLLRGGGVGPWSRQSVSNALKQLLQARHERTAGATVGTTLASGKAARGIADLYSAAEALTRAVSAAAKRPDSPPLRPPGLPSLSADEAVPLRFLTAAARLRCRAFGLSPLPDPEETQQLLGRIVPATATATTLAAALACLEVYRLAALRLAGSHGMPFLAEAPPLRPPTLRFRGGRWGGQPLSPWNFFRLRLRGSTEESTRSNVSNGVDVGAVVGETEAASALTIAELVRLIETDAGVRVQSLTCEDTLLYSALEEGSALKQHYGTLTPQIAELFDTQPQPQLLPLPDPKTLLSEALQQVISMKGRSKGQQEQNRQKQQEKEQLVWAVVVISALDSAGADAPLPPLKALIKA